MTVSLTSTGLAIETQAEIQAAFEAAQRANISDRLDVSTTSPHGQHNAIVARAMRLGQEALAAVYLSIDPDSATGDALDRLCAITGINRSPATKTRSTVVVSVDPGTYAIGSLVAQVTGRPENTFSNVAEVVNSGGSVANVSAVFESTVTGAVQCPLDTLAIAGPLAGWNSIVSNTEGALGAEVETDAALRIRREKAVAVPGSASATGIAADILSNVTGVISAAVTENDTDATVDSVPPHAVEAIVYGPVVPTSSDDTAVAEQILASKSAGIGTYGTTSVSVTDTQGYAHLVKFTRPTVDILTITIAVDVNSATYAGDASLAAALATASVAAFEPGLDASGSMIAAWAHAVPGVLRVTDVTINGGASWATWAVSTRSIELILAEFVTVTSTPAVP